MKKTQIAFEMAQKPSAFVVSEIACAYLRRDVRALTTGIWSANPARRASSAWRLPSV